MADVNGIINVEVIYREAGGSGASASDVTGGGGGASGGGAAADKKKTTGLLSEMSKFAKMTAASLTVGAAIKNSKIMSGFLGTMSQMLGALVDVFLMPFIPLLIPVMKVMAGLIKWLVKFMEDPIGTIKEVWGNIADFVMNDLKEFGKSLFTVTFWQELWGDIDWEQILKMGVGGAGLVGLIAALSGGISLAMAAPGLITGLLKNLIPGMSGSKGVGKLLNPCCGPGIGSRVVPAVVPKDVPKGVPLPVKLIAIAPPVTAALLLAGAVIGGDGLPGELGDVLKTFNQHLGSLNEYERNILIEQRMTMSLKDQHAWMKNILDNLGPSPVPTPTGLPTSKVYSLTGENLTPNPYESLREGSRLNDLNPYELLREGSRLGNNNDMNVTIEVIPPEGTGLFDSASGNYTYKVDVLANRDNQKWAMEG